MTSKLFSGVVDDGPNLLVNAVFALIIVVVVGIVFLIFRKIRAKARQTRKK
jgi:hypothetical protein